LRLDNTRASTAPERCRPVAQRPHLAARFVRRAHAMADRDRQLLRQKGFIAAASMAVALLAWWPPEFSPQAASTLAERAVWLRVPPARDAIVNMLLFLPIGAAIHHRAVPTFRGVVAYALALSIAIELGQVFLPERIVSTTDVVLNTAGAACGALLMRAGPAALNWLASAAPHPLWIAAATTVLIAVLFGRLQEGFAALDTWSVDLPLLIGNEATGDRPWLGEVHAFALAAGTREWTRDSFAFEVRRPSRIGDASLGPPWLQTVQPAADFNAAVRLEGSFAATLLAQTDHEAQRGPARILSISSDPSHRNLTLGQDGPDLIVRIRRRWAGQNGRRPYYRLAGVLRRDRQVSVAVVADGDSTRIVTNGESLVDHHDIAAQWWILLLPSHEWRGTGLDLPATFAFWALLLGPLAALLGAASIERRWKTISALTLAAAVGVAAWAVITMADVTVGWESLIAMPLVAAAAAAWTRRQALPGRPGG